MRTFLQFCIFAAFIFFAAFYFHSPNAVSVPSDSTEMREEQKIPVATKNIDPARS